MWFSQSMFILSVMGFFLLWCCVVLEVVTNILKECKRRHGITSHRTTIDIFTAVRIWNLCVIILLAPFVATSPGLVIKSLPTRDWTFTYWDLHSRFVVDFKHRVIKIHKGHQDEVWTWALGGAKWPVSCSDCVCPHKTVLGTCWLQARWAAGSFRHEAKKKLPISDYDRGFEFLVSDRY
jgi:hypothetical protein